MNDFPPTLQVTACLGEQLPQTSASAAPPLVPVLLAEQATIASPPLTSVHRRTTSTLLDWTDDIAAIEAGLNDDMPCNQDLETAISGSSIDILKGLEAIAARSLESSLSSEQAAAKALLNAARNTRQQKQRHSAGSRYLHGKKHNQKKVLHTSEFLVHALTVCLNGLAPAFFSPCLHILTELCLLHFCITESLAWAVHQHARIVAAKAEHCLWLHMQE